MTGDSRLRIGSVAWLSAVQFFIAQAVVAAAWSTPFSLADRHISDLGNTGCGSHAAGSATIVCSPSHALMNASFIAIGITMALGGVLTQAAFTRGLRRTAAALLFGLAGAGVILVGLYPENEATTPHVVGAAVNFVAGNVAVMLFGLALPARRRLLRIFSVAAGLTGLAGTLLFAAGMELGVGSGFVERLAVYPMPIWQMAAGYAFLRAPLTPR